MRVDLPSLAEPGAAVLAVGAHADDVEIGAGGTLLRLRAQHPDLHLRWLVCTAAGERADEARAAAAAFGADEVVLLDLEDRFLPDAWRVLKERIAAEVAAMPRCDLVLAPWRLDRHQDHRAVGEVVWQVARRSAIWAYEVVKHEDDLGHPGVFVALDEAVVDRKVALLHEHFASQRDRGWFDERTFRAIARLRGVHAGVDHAEAFHVEKVVW